MATAVFRSNGRRSSFTGPFDVDSVNRFRRSRSLSRYSGRFPPPSPDIDEFETPRGKFVNKVRGSGFLEISLDDLAEEFFRATAEDGDQDAASATGRSSRRTNGKRWMAETESSRQRGRSVSRKRSDSATATGKGVSGNNENWKARRSVSVSRSRRSELEVDKTAEFRHMSKNRMNSVCGGNQNTALQKQSGQDRALGRSRSQKDFFQSQDCCSSHSSSLTDEEAHDARSTLSVSEKTIREVYAIGKINHSTGTGDGFRHWENKSKKAQSLVEELMELEKSEKRKQNLLAELAIEEKRGQELCKLVRELLSSTKETVELAKPLQPCTSRWRCGDTERISKCLDEEAEKFFEDFLSNVEDTDLSSFDGERSDTGSTTKLTINNDATRIDTDCVRNVSLPAETDGVIFPWLQWEASNCSSPSPCKSKTAIKQNSDNVKSSLGSFSPEVGENFCSISEGRTSRHGAAESQSNNSVVPERGSSFDMDEYLQIQHREELLLEMWEHRQRIASGSLLLCGRIFI